MSAFIEGRDAALAGQTLANNPYTNGFTKLGNVKLTEEGHDWQNGFNSVSVRVASHKEMQDAAKLDISRFRRKSNRYYGK